MSLVLPLTVAQRRQWSLTQDNGSDYGWLAVVVEIPRSIPESEITARLTSLVATHEALRARTVETDHGPAQLIEPHGDLRIDVHTSILERGDACTDPAGEAIRIARALGLDPATGSFRFVVLRIGRRTVICVLVHHVFADAAAMAHLYGDLIGLFRHGRTAPAAPSAQLSDIPTPGLAAREAPTLDHWIRVLGGPGGGSPFEFLPTYQPLPHRGAELVFSRASAATLWQCCRASELSMPALINSAIGVLLQAYGPGHTPIIQTVVSNRWSDLEAAVVANLTNSSYIVADSVNTRRELVRSLWRGHLISMKNGWFDRLALDEALTDAPDSRYVRDISAISNIWIVAPMTADSGDSPPVSGPYLLRTPPDLIPPVDPCRTRNAHLHVFAYIGESALRIATFASDALSAYRAPDRIATDLFTCLQFLANRDDRRLSDLGIVALR